MFTSYMERIRSAKTVIHKIATIQLSSGWTKSLRGVRLEHRNVKAITLLKCYNITTEQHWDLITTIRITIRIFP